MESYEEFCLRSLENLQNGRKYKKGPCEELCSPKARSVIRFHGRAALPPLLSPEQRSEMCDHRRTAVQLESDRKNKQRNKRLGQTQPRLDPAQPRPDPAQPRPDPAQPRPDPAQPRPDPGQPRPDPAQPKLDPVQAVRSENVDKLSVSTGYTLVSDAPGRPRDSGHKSVTPCCGNLALNGYEEVKEVEQGEKSEEEEEEEEEDMSLDSLLKRSREYVKREQLGSNGAHAAAWTLSETASDKQKSPNLETGVEFGFSLHHSPVGAPQTQIQHQTVPISPVLSERYARLPSPQSSISPRVQKRRPRPVSTGNIHISFPIGPDVVPRGSGRSGEVTAMSNWEEALVAATKSSSHWCSVEGDGGLIQSGIRRSSHCGTAPVQEAYSPISASMISPTGSHDPLTAGFRRRCHTLDSQHQSYSSRAEHIDRSQERIPRFMAGVTWSASGHRAPAVALNQSYEVESPSASLLRPRVSPDLAQVAAMMGPVKPQGPKTITTNAADALMSKNAEETQRRAQALEDMQRHLEEEHALQMSLLLAEQEKEQQRLCLELEQTELRLKGRRCARPLSADACDWNHRSLTSSCPLVSPSCPRLSPAHTPPEKSFGHTIGFSSPVNPSVSPPPVQPPVYLWGPTWAASKPRARLSLVLTAEQQRVLCRIGALVRGFLTRRLLKTEKIKQLRQTVVDTQEFMSSFQIEASQRKSSCSAQDLSLQERVGAQLRAALYDIHDIFFETPLRDRLAFLQQDRELRAERKLRDMEKTKCSKERVSLSAATQRSLDRKKKVGESPAQSRKMQQKPKSPTTNRVLKQSQGQNSPVSGQLNRQGSWYKKTPEERVKRSDNLKKQHSLG